MNYVTLDTIKKSFSTCLTDNERPYQSCVNVFGCVEVRVVESGQAVAVVQ